MTHHQARDDVAAAAGRRSDDDPESFALVERLGGVETKSTRAKITEEIEPLSKGEKKNRFFIEKIYT